jgi:hypothetical protein
LTQIIENEGSINIMAEITSVFEHLQRIIDEIAKLLKSDTEIEEELYFKLVGDYSKELKGILNTYFASPDTLQTLMSPFLNYYRQLQHYFVFIIRYPLILKVPHHSEILQTLAFIENRDQLIKERYEEFSKTQKALLTGDFIKDLDQLLELKLKKIKK